MKVQSKWIKMNLFGIDLKVEENCFLSERKRYKTKCKFKMIYCEYDLAEH